jgi:hypothetical protein
MNEYCVDMSALTPTPGDNGYVAEDTHSAY